MFLGQVTGSVWGARQAKGLEGLKLLEVRPIRLIGAPGAEASSPVAPEACELADRVIVAADSLGAGEGEYVLVATGSRVRDIVYDGRRPLKAVVVAIVDSGSIDLGVVT